MSASFEKLSSLVKAAVAKITSLEAQVAGLSAQVADLTAKAGTPDSDIDALSSQLQAVLPSDAPADGGASA